MHPPSVESPFCPFFIGVDSDGTVFNSMEIKHKRVFQPIAVELWGLQSVGGIFNEIAESINLYSAHRGVNRFAGLSMVFAQLSRVSAQGRALVSGYENLEDFVESGEALSFKALSAFNEKRCSPFLNKVLEWSVCCDERYAAIMEAEGNPPYAGVRETLSRAFPRCEIVVISSSSKITLEKDWGDAGLLDVVTRVEGQEEGTKTRQLESALRGARRPAQTLMIGDALGDLEAARAHGMQFFPIVPGAEEASWQLLENEAMDRFFNSTYAGDYEDEQVEAFIQVLLPGQEAKRAYFETSVR